MRKTKAKQNANRLEAYFELQRRENEAAKHIQTAWRRTRILLPWRQAVRMMMAIVTIQRRVRGMIARNLVGKWFFMRNSFAIEIQARTRRHLSNLKMRPILAHERRMAILIQRIARGKLARNRAKAVLTNLAATRIQALWRGCVDRSRADRFWLNKAVITIQNAARRKLALNRYEAEKARLTRAAVVIQRKFRSYQAAIIIGEKLFARELTYRNNCIKTFVAEAELCNEKIERLMDRAVHSQIKEKAVLAQTALQEEEKFIYGIENDLSELIHQRETLSPRAIQQGFDEELDKNIAEYRIKLTQHKLHCLFHLQRDTHRADTLLEQQVAELEDWASARNRAEKYNMQEYEDRRHVTYHRDITARRKAKQRAIAHERRTWQVLYYTRDGKPDKKRRPGKPWDPSVYAGAERATYCGGANVDLLAYVKQNNPLYKQTTQNSKTKKKLKKKGKSSTGIGIGEEGDKDLAASVKSTVEKVSLQTFLEEVKVYEELLDPISAILEKNTGLAPDSRPPEELGWGPEGAELATALQTLQGGKPKKVKRFGVGRNAPGNNSYNNSYNNSAANSVSPSRASSSRTVSRTVSRPSSRPSSPPHSHVQQDAANANINVNIHSGSQKTRPPVSKSLFSQRGGFKTVILEQDDEDVSSIEHGFEPPVLSPGSSQNSRLVSRQPSQRTLLQEAVLNTDAMRQESFPKRGILNHGSSSSRPVSATYDEVKLSKQVSFQDLFSGHDNTHNNNSKDKNSDKNKDKDMGDDNDSNILTSAAELLEQTLLRKSKNRPSRFHKKTPKSYLPAEDTFTDKDVFVRRHTHVNHATPSLDATDHSVLFPASATTSAASTSFAFKNVKRSLSQQQEEEVEEVQDLPRRAFHRAQPPLPQQQQQQQQDTVLSMKHQEQRLLSRSLPSSASTSNSTLNSTSYTSSLSMKPPLPLSFPLSSSLSETQLQLHHHHHQQQQEDTAETQPSSFKALSVSHTATPPSISAMMRASLPLPLEQFEADLARSQQLHATRRDKKKTQRRLGVIPWELLDEADGMRHRFENEKRYVEFNKKF